MYDGNFRTPPNLKPKRDLIDPCVTHSLLDFAITHPDSASNVFIKELNINKRIPEERR